MLDLKVHLTRGCHPSRYLVPSSVHLYVEYMNIFVICLQVVIFKSIVIDIILYKVFTIQDCTNKLLYQMIIFNFNQVSIMCSKSSFC